MVYLSPDCRKQTKNPALAGSYNIGPEEYDCITTGELVDLFCKAWGDGAHWIDQSEPNAPHEAGFLKLDSRLMKMTFGWKPKWNIDECMKRVVRAGKLRLSSGEIENEMKSEIEEFSAE